MHELKIAVFSDSHGNTSNMQKAIELFAPDCIIHLGDTVSDAETIRGSNQRLRMHMVSGNCDYAPDVPDSLLIEEGGVRIFMAHGHRYGVKLSPESFLNSVCCSGALIGLYGHTHIPLCVQTNGVTLLNPGSCGGMRPTYGQIEIENGSFNCKIAEIGR